MSILSIYGLLILVNLLLFKYLINREVIKPDLEFLGFIILAAPIMFIMFVIYFIVYNYYRKDSEKATVDYYNKRLPEIWYKFNRFINHGKPSILDNASTFDKQYDEYIEDYFSNFRPIYDKVKVVKTEVTDNGPKDILTSYHEAMNIVSQIARQTQQPIITATQRPAVRSKYSSINHIFNSLTHRSY